ncbi:hypothetical protein HYQ46_010541 [Verticillium longisporum]|nr:hypothetical protein HYQ46_010541 [Verticillium longisporum]
MLVAGSTGSYRPRRMGLKTEARRNGTATSTVLVIEGRVGSENKLVSRAERLVGKLAGSVDAVTRRVAVPVAVLHGGITN